MSCFKVSNEYSEDPQFMTIPNASIGLWAKAGAWSIKHKSNGNIPKSVIRQLKGTESQCRKLVDSGLWTEKEHGYMFVNWRKHQDGKYRKNIRKSVRDAVMQRDNYQCVWCGTTDNLSLDHIIKYSAGGEDSIENLRVLCMPCNQSREKGVN